MMHCFSFYITWMAAAVFQLCMNGAAKLNNNITQANDSNLEYSVKTYCLESKSLCWVILCTACYGIFYLAQCWWIAWCVRNDCCCDSWRTVLCNLRLLYCAAELFWCYEWGMLLFRWVFFVFHSFIVKYSPAMVMLCEHFTTLFFWLNRPTTGVNPLLTSEHSLFVSRLNSFRIRWRLLFININYCFRIRGWNQKAFVIFR